MRIRTLRTAGFRNLVPDEIKFGSRLAVLWGENGQGKTNLLEAVYTLAAQRSFRTSRTDELIARGAESAEISAEVETGDLTRRVDVRLGPGERRARLDGKVVRGGAAIFGGLHAVVFVPEHLMLLRAAPAQRRRFLDLIVFGLDRAYYREAVRFDRVLRSRNALLRRGVTEPALLETYDEELARHGARLVIRRRALVEALAPLFASAFAEVIGSEAAPLAAHLRYRGHPEIEAAADEAAVTAALRAGFAARVDLDLHRRRTGFGPHLDDLEVDLGGRLAREHASQGQARALVLALKLAELALIEARRGEAPVLLLDDVASELDARRRAHLFEKVAAQGAQALITVTDRAAVPPHVEREDFQVVNGRFRFTAD